MKILDKELFGCPILLLAAIGALVGTIMCVCVNGIVASNAFEEPPAAKLKHWHVYVHTPQVSLQVDVAGSDNATGYIWVNGDRIYMRDLTYSDLVVTMQTVLKELPADHSLAVDLRSDSDTVATAMVEQALRDAGFKSISRS